eukprot:768271-Hanusia_phi.AAC.1
MGVHGLWELLGVTGRKVEVQVRVMEANQQQVTGSAGSWKQTGGGGCFDLDYSVHQGDEAGGTNMLPCLPHAD